ncbi:MAG: hypothetical protein ABIY37_14670 [Devosia sp.]
MRVLIAMLLALWALPALAYDDPKALVDAIYAPYTTLGAARDQDPAQYYSERLRGLVSANAAAEGDTAAPILDFNPFIGAQQALLRDLVIGAPVVNADKAMVTVSFGNFDQAALLALSLVRDADGWKVDDIASLGEGQNWLLSWLLQYDPFAIR